MDLVYSQVGTVASNFKISGLAGCMNSTTLLKVEKNPNVLKRVKIRKTAIIKEWKPGNVKYPNVSCLLI
jgi:predicted thioredoxin/glutaredoxin